MTTIIDWPRAWWPWVTGQFALMPKSQRSSSPWTQRQNIYGPHVQYWTAKFTFKPLRNVEASQREALIERLGGGANLLRMGHPLRAHPQYSREQTPTTEPFSDSTLFTDGSGWVSGLLPPQIYCAGSAARGETSVIVGGLPLSTARVLRAGDCVEFQRDGIADETPSFHRVVRDAPTDAFGETRIEFLPPLRKGLAAGDAVVLDYPTTVFRLTDDSQGMVDYQASIGAMGFSLIEALL